MTRINCGIPVSELTDKHLLAEHREIKRIPNQISSGKYSMSDCPENFTLGKGHVKFFYNKLGYLYSRYNLIYLECKRRGFNVTYFGSAWNSVPKYLFNQYTPSIIDTEIVRRRINEKLQKTKNI